jgi:kynurenine 3-monooxygenase
MKMRRFRSPSVLHRGGRPELAAISWIREKMLFENSLHTLRANITMRLGINVIGRAKSSTTSWSQVRADAKRLGPLWL